MDDIEFQQEILEIARGVPPEKRLNFLNGVRQAAGKRPRGISGKEAIRIMRDINISKEDLAQMAQAIEEIDMYDYWEAKSKPVKATLFDVVALRQDMDEHELRRGQVGTIVEILGDDVFEVEFTDNEGRTYSTLALKSEQLMVLHYEPAASNQ